MGSSELDLMNDTKTKSVHAMLHVTVMPLGFQIWVGKHYCGGHNLPLSPPANGITNMIPLEGKLFSNVLNMKDL